MGLFKRDRKDKQAAAEVLGQVERSRELADQLSAKAGRDLGMDIDALMREGARATADGGQQQMLAYATLMARLSQSGVETPARVRSVELAEPSPMQGGLPAQLRLTVEPPAASPYDVTIDQVLHESVAAGLAVDRQVTVKVDPDDPTCAILWGTEPAPSAEPAAEDSEPSARLAKLEQLRTSGVLSDEEFETQKAKLLS
jgi:hypothetical protein